MIGEIHHLKDEYFIRNHLTELPSLVKNQEPYSSKPAIQGLELVVPASSTLSCLLIWLSIFLWEFQVPSVISISYKILIFVSEPHRDSLSVTGRSQYLKIVFAFMLMSLHFAELNVRFYFILTYYIILSLLAGSKVGF